MARVKSTITANRVKFTAYCGLCSFAVICIGAMLSAWFYSGRTNEPYSFFNHFISELGNRHYSSHAYFFNGAIGLAGIPLIIFMAGISAMLGSRIRHALLFTGIISGVFCILLGYYSSDRFDIHIKVALAQFNTMLFSSLLFSIAVLRDGVDGRFNRWLAYAGAVPVVLIAIFLGMNFAFREQVKNGHIHYLLYHRPAFWLVPFMEWLVFFSLIAWVAMICLYLLYGKGGDETIT